MAWAKGERQNELWFVNTRCSCFCVLALSYSFVSRWRSSFVTAYEVTAIAATSTASPSVTANVSPKSPPRWFRQRRATPKPTKDRGDKLKEYQRIPRLQEYVLIDASQISIERYQWGKGRMWLYFAYEPGDVVESNSLGFSGSIDCFYEDVQFSVA